MCVNFTPGFFHTDRLRSSFSMYANLKCMYPFVQFKFWYMATHKHTHAILQCSSTSVGLLRLIPINAQVVPILALSTGMVEITSVLTSLCMAVTNGFRAVGNSADFLPHTHSPDNISQFISYLKLLLLPEVKYGEHLLPVGEKKPCI